jgi:hypothetical protein
MSNAERRLKNDEVEIRESHKTRPFTQFLSPARRGGFAFIINLFASLRLCANNLSQRREAAKKA